MKKDIYSLLKLKNKSQAKFCIVAFDRKRTRNRVAEVFAEHANIVSQDPKLNIYIVSDELYPLDTYSLKFCFDNFSLDQYKIKVYTFENLEELRYFLTIMKKIHLKNATNNPEPEEYNLGRTYLSDDEYSGVAGLKYLKEVLIK